MKSILKRFLKAMGIYKGYFKAKQNSTYKGNKDSKKRTVDTSSEKIKSYIKNKPY